MAIDLWLTLSIGQPWSKQFDIEQTLVHCSMYFQQQWATKDCLSIVFCELGQVPQFIKPSNPSSRHCYSGLIPAPWIILPHRTDSFFWNAPKASGVIG